MNADPLISHYLTAGDLLALEAKVRSDLPWIREERMVLARASDASRALAVAIDRAVRDGRLLRSLAHGLRFASGVDGPLAVRPSGGEGPITIWKDRVEGWLTHVETETLDAETREEHALARRWLAAGWSAHYAFLEMTEEAAKEAVVDVLDEVLGGESRLPSIARAVEKAAEAWGKTWREAQASTGATP